MTYLLSGLGLILLSAACNGAFAVPLKLRRRYEWENTWVICHLFAMLIIPLVSAALVLPDWPKAIEAVGFKTVVIVAAFGFVWGIGTVTFAVGINTIGISLGYAIIMGVVTAVGATIPMVRKWTQISNTAQGIILFGIAICIAGVAVCGRAGMLREKQTSHSSSPITTSASSIATRTFLVGVAWCVLSGILSAGNNLGFDFADRIANEVQMAGASPIFASLGRWIAVYWGGYLAVLIFCGAKMLRKGTWKRYTGPGTLHDAGLALLMGLLHFLSQLAYGMGAYYVGRLGTTVGFAVMVATSLIFANVFGFIVGEWRLAPKRSVNVLYVGLTLLIASVLVLAYGNSFV
jgi:L-rhamnose-H+ transport protein